MKTLFWMTLLALSACAAESGGPRPQAAPHASASEERGQELVHAGLDLGKERRWDFEGARADYEAVLRAEPKNEAAALALARVLVRLGQAEAAERVLITARKAMGERPDLLNALSSVARARRKIPDAIAYAKAVLLRDPQNADASNAIALAYLADGKLEAAELFAQTALKSAAEPSGLYVTLAMIQLKRGDAQRAMTLYMSALERDPKNAIAHLDAGFLALQYRDYPLALQEIETAIQLGQSGKDAAAARCFALEGLQKGAEAASCLQALSEKLSATDAELPQVLYSLGMVHQNLTRDSAQALLAFRRYLEVKGSSLTKNDRVPELVRKLEGGKAPAEEPSLKPKAELKRRAFKRAHRRA